MVQLLCNGVELELHADTAVEFIKTNPLFAFLNLSCERTTTIRIPQTAHNDEVFGLSHIPAYKGQAMRERFVAELRVGVVVKQGYLYVDSYSGGDYSCMFVGGGLFGLKILNEAGNLREVLAESTEQVLAGLNVVAASTTEAKSDLWRNVQYQVSENSFIKPSVLVSGLLDRLAQVLGVGITYPSQVLEGVRVIINDLPTPQDVPCVMKSEMMGGWNNEVSLAGMLRGYVTSRARNGWISTTYTQGHYSPHAYVLHTETTRVTWQVYYAEQDIILTFPQDFPQDMFLVAPNSVDDSTATFLGDYSFTKSFIYTNQFDVQTTINGVPLSGRSVEIAKGTIFTLVKSGDYSLVGVNGVYEEQDCSVIIKGWQYTGVGADKTNGNYEQAVSISVAKKESESGDIVRMVDVLPTWSVVQLLQAVAYTFGLMIDYTDEGGVVLRDTISFGVREDMQVIKHGTLKRTFADYAQHNKIAFVGNVIEAEQPKIAYNVANVNLESEKELYKVPVSVGGVGYDSAGRTIVVVAEDEKEPTYMLCDVATTGERVVPKISDVIEQLSYQSTSIDCEVWMSAYAFNLIKSDDLLLIDGTLYAWIDSKWSDGVARFNLQKWE